MKKLIFILAVMLLPFTANAQSELWGDMNNDGKVTTADIMKLVDIVLLGHPAMTVSPSSVTILTGETADVKINNGSGLFEVNSLNPNIVQLSINGRTITLNALSSGETTIIVKDTYTKKLIDFPVIVDNSPLLLSQSEISLYGGEQGTIEITFGSGSYNVESSDTNVASATISGSTITITAGESGSTIITVTDTESGLTANIDVTVSDYETSSFCPDDNHPHMIDLGLPSGTKWSCCNVGATNPSEFGGYYAWGESETKDIFNWDNYKHCHGTEESCYNIGADISGTQYDVAHVKWGGNWQMPNLSDINELSMNCSYSSAKMNGVNGYKLTGSNKKSIFIPAAGYKRNNTFESSSAYLWMSVSTMQWSWEEGACCSDYYYFGGYGISYYDNYMARCLGLPVRPVVPAEQ